MRKEQIKEVQQRNEFNERQSYEEKDDAETSPDFLEGDIAIPELH